MLRAGRTLPRLAPTLRTATLSAPVSVRYQSSTPSRPEPASRAAALIDTLPGNSVISKTGWVTLGTGLTAYAVSSELYVINEETVILGSFAAFAVFVATQVRTPYKDWAESQVEKIKGLLNATRKEHTQAVQTRIDSVGEMKDVVDVTKALFALSKETAKLEHESFTLRQKSVLAQELKSTLDSWVRFEAQVREGEQRDLVNSIRDKVAKDLADARLQKEILANAVTEVENLVKSKAI
ncbi:hypothetical protein E5Q_00318 [Mixia osmundae IAM 14324]|uniref:ATP synthase subunit 4 n=2 Tax=Mixia osmundae (strain CBS 9802 / IAM 14324 / JCM 22182 / KY 12970) TaxID=764103 RepID=G7DSW3_MIXOS|nr:hypothetical protein E5Q_00318 [Mixia osmundae IAM 14324]